MNARPSLAWLSGVLVLIVAGVADAQVDARMFRQPTVSQSQIAFVYAGDIWVVSKTGGTATRLSSPQGEESFPRFSPDGAKIAYSAAYDGNTDVYVVSTGGGEPVRLTHHPMPDRVVGWHPDGKRVLFASSRESGRQRFSQFYLVGTDGGLPEKLPVPYGEFGAVADNGTDFVYMPMSQDFRTWKRYRGGWAPDLWLFNLKTFASRNLTSDPANDAQPMWHGSTIYFVSDRGATERNNIWAMDVASGKARQVTQFTDFDITFPSIGGDSIVFQAGGRLYLLDCASEKATEVPIRVITDETTLRPRTVKADALIADASVSPTGRRAAFGTRGDVVTVPAENGAVVNLTRTSGVAERYPRWSPDGKMIAYWSDKSGEYELTLRAADGSGTEQKVTSLGPGFRYTPYWSPDSKKLAFIDQAMKIRIYDVAAGRIVDVDQSPDWISHGSLEPFRFEWSPDSRWLTYARPASTSNNAIFLSQKKKFAMVELKPAQKFEKPMATADIEVPVDPRAEWRQLFTDAYRFERDFFYDPSMHGVDWAALRGRYATLLNDAVTRWDVNFVLGEFIGELNASHTYRGGGDEEKAPQRSVGMLGVDWELSNGAYRIKRIVAGGPWDAAARSPLGEPGVNVKAGDYVLAVNGLPLNTKADPWSSFQGLGDKTVVLTVNGAPSTAGARQVVVKCLTDETELRFRAWIEERRQQVDKATGGKVGYVYVQSTGVEAQNELMRQFIAQWKKDGLVIDERWNSGGQIPDRFIELLNRPILSYWAVRDAPSQQWPPVSNRGPQVMLINGWSGSGGDAFPFYFREAGRGPLIGTRTWGGLIGISGAPALVDGGNVTVPTFRMYDPKGAWFAEGHGVEPDIAVAEDPTALAKGSDPQLDRAIREVTDRLATQPAAPPRPAYERRVPKGGGD